MRRANTDWRAPTALGLLTASGLLSALVSDGMGDMWSWVGLSAPLFTAAWFVLRRPRPVGSERAKQSTRQK